MSTELVYILAALVAIFVGVAGAMNYRRQRGISLTRLVSAGAYTLAFLGLFFTWMGFTVSNCIGTIICFGTQSGADNIFGISGGIDHTLQSAIISAVNNGNPGASTIQSIVNGLITESYVIMASTTVALALVIWTLLPPASASNSVTSSRSSHRSFLPAATIVMSIVGVITIGLIMMGITTLTNQYSDMSVSWSIGIGEYITGIGLIIGAITRLMDLSVIVSLPTGA